MIKKKIVRILSGLFLIAALGIGCQQPNGEEPKKTIDNVLEDAGLDKEGEKTGTTEEINKIAEGFKNQGLKEGKDFEITVNEKGETVIKLTEKGKEKLEEQLKVENGEKTGREIVVDFTKKENLFVPFAKGDVNNYFSELDNLEEIGKDGIALGDTVKIKFQGHLPIDFDEFQVGVYAIKNNTKIYLNKDKFITVVSSKTANTDFEFETNYKNTILDNSDVSKYGIEFVVKTQDFTNDWIFYEKGDALKSEDDYLKVVPNENGNGIDIVLKDLSSLGLERVDHNAGFISVFGVNDVEVFVENDKKVDSTYTYPFVKAGETVYVKYAGILKSTQDNKEYWKDNYYKIKATSGKNLEDYVIDYDSYKEIKVTIDRDGYKFTTNLDTNGKTLVDYFNLVKVTDITADYSLLAGKVDWSNTDWIGGNSFKYDKYNQALLTNNRNYNYDYDIFTDGIPAVWNNENDIEIKIKKRGYLYSSYFRLKFKIDGVDNWVRLKKLDSPEYVDKYKPAEKNIDIDTAFVNAVSGVEKTPATEEELLQFIGELIQEISAANSQNSSARMVTPSIPATKDYATISNALIGVPSEINKIVEQVINGSYKIDFEKAINIGLAKFQFLNGLVWFMN